mmetsp:Transcript_26900/g.75174  ORF Transcript_26900/g.75174 Transcript_26900/m.75174 type:complete len:270 (-) Transcript_26900:195-1004(-)
MTTLSTPWYMLCLVLSVAQCLEALHTSSIHTDAHVHNGGYDHIMLFAMAKVGSETMKASLNATYVPGTLTSYPPIVKVHYAKVANDYMQKLPPGSNTLVISIVRNPIDQQKSLFFQLLEDGFYPGLKLGQASVAQLVEEFPKRIGPSAFSDHWKTLAELTGVDVMEQQFDFDGHQLLAHNAATNVSVLVLRLEDIGYWQEIMTQHVPNFVLRTQNVGSQKGYADQYEAFKKSYLFPPDALRTIRSHKHNHFYTTEERNRFETLERHPAQ